MIPLRQQFLDELRRRNYSPRTLEAYLSALILLTRHFHRAPDQLTPEDLRAFQIHLLDQHTSWSRFNQIASALRFFYAHVLQRPDFVPWVVYGRKPQTLPVVLSPTEVWRWLAAFPNDRQRLRFRTVYACGLRISELLHLKLSDIDSARMLLWVRCGKGQKDRAVPLCQALLTELRAYWRRFRPADWLFPNPQGQPLHPAGLQRDAKRAARQAGLTKSVTVHTLRHCYATHLLEAGTDLPTLQRLLGHSSVQTTMRYLHLRSERLQVVRSPLELFTDLEAKDGQGTTEPRARRRGA